MKRLAFLIGGAAALALSACSGSNQDAVNNAELNQPESDLNEIANQAAMDAANAQAAAQANIQNAMEQENASVDNAESANEADEQNVSGM